MFTKKIKDYTYCWCKPEELNKVIQEHSKFTLVFLVTHVEDTTDWISEIGKYLIGEYDTTKFTVLRRKKQKGIDICKQIFNEMVPTLEKRSTFNNYIKPFNPIGVLRRARARIANFYGV